MSKSTIYKSRLAFAARQAGVFNWNTESKSWVLPSGNPATLTVRGKPPLAEAREFHIEASGFTTAREAWEVGEDLRTSLQLANALLGLRLQIPSPTQEVVKTKLADGIKKKIIDEHGVDTASVG